LQVHLRRTSSRCHRTSVAAEDGRTHWRRHRCSTRLPGHLPKSAESIDSPLISAQSATASRCWERGCHFRHGPTVPGPQRAPPRKQSPHRSVLFVDATPRHAARDRRAGLGRGTKGGPCGGVLADGSACCRRFHSAPFHFDRQVLPWGKNGPVSSPGDRATKSRGSAWCRRTAPSWSCPGQMARSRTGTPVEESVAWSSCDPRGHELRASRCPTTPTRCPSAETWNDVPRYVSTMSRASVGLLDDRSHRSSEQMTRSSCGAARGRPTTYRKWSKAWLTGATPRVTI
jgi:hypothetical protein